MIKFDITMKYEGNDDDRDDEEAQDNEDDDMHVSAISVVMFHYRDAMCHIEIIVA